MTKEKNLKLKKQQPTRPAEQPLERKFRQYAETYPKPQQRALLFISSLMLMLGLLGICWAIPFPHLKFLGQYNGFINWASFFIAIAGYYYYRLSPFVCYPIILVLFVFAYLVTKLAEWHQAGGPSLLLICGALTAAALLMAIQITKRVMNNISLGTALTFYLITPAWHFNKLLRKHN